MWSFTPIASSSIPTSPPVFITTLQYYRKNRETGTLELVTEDITYQKVVKLTYREKILMFQFAALSYSKPLNNQYAYQLEGFDDQWIQLGTRHEATFTNLPPGRYTLRVKGANGDGVWNDTPTELAIIILPPWYWAGWSKALYALLLAAAVWFFYRFQLGRRLAQVEALRLRELDAFKTRFYTNITHEFRTPLTVIMGMADRIRESPRQWLHQGLPMIRSNSERLPAPGESDAGPVQAGSRRLAPQYGPERHHRLAAYGHGAVPIPGGAQKTSN
jgi:signal transduction histidine kinase